MLKRTPLRRKTRLKRGTKPIQRTKLRPRSAPGTHKALLKQVQTRYNLLRRLEESDDQGLCTCITCGRKLHFSLLDCGHAYHTQAHPVVRMDRINTNPQCGVCNRYNDGEQSLYTIALIDKYGQQAFDDLVTRAKSVRKVMRIELEEDLIQINERIKQEIKRVQKF